MMRGSRTYPPDPAGPFPTPPSTFEDKEGRLITIEPIGGAGIGVDEATDDDVVDALTQMYRRFDPEDRAQGIPPLGEESIRNWLEPIVHNGINVAARDGDAGTYAGHATLVPDTNDPDDVEDVGDIEWELAIFVLQAYQRAGIGTVMLENLLGYAADLGVEQVWLTVERWNGPAINLYERVGFQVCGSESFDREMSIRLPADDD